VQAAYLDFVHSINRWLSTNHPQYVIVGHNADVDRFAHQNSQRVRRAWARNKVGREPSERATTISVHAAAVVVLTVLGTEIGKLNEIRELAAYHGKRVVTRAVRGAAPALVPSLSTLHLHAIITVCTGRDCTQ
jgi:hypothetical protein